MSGRSLFVGLGNPGAEYAGQRHNIGFMAVDAIARRHRFSSFRGKFHGEICEGRLGLRDILILKPMTYMNESGIAVAAAARFFKIPLVDIMVFHDELDLAPGKVKVKRGGGHAGHNGLRSIDAHIGADFGRVRLGIGHPGSKDRVLGYVLGNFSTDDRRWLDPLLDVIADNAGILAAGDDARFMSRLSLGNTPNGKDRPEKVDPTPSNLRPKDGI